MTSTVCLSAFMRSYFNHMGTVLLVVMPVIGGVLVLQ
jgi:hypothetical protein